MKKEILIAITTRTKIKFRPKTSPADMYIIFHPYAIIEDVLFGTDKMYGVIEKHHSDFDLANTKIAHSIEQIDKIILTDEKFKVQKDWEKEIDATKFDINFRADN